jgi:hypothetical protein
LELFRPFFKRLVQAATRLTPETPPEFVFLAVRVLGHLVITNHAALVDNLDYLNLCEFLRLSVFNKSFDDANCANCANMGHVLELIIRFNGRYPFPDAQSFPTLLAPFSAGQTKSAALHAVRGSSLLSTALAEGCVVITTPSAFGKFQWEFHEAMGVLYAAGDAPAFAVDSATPRRRSTPLNTSAITIYF